MARMLSSEEQKLWNSVTKSVKPIGGGRVTDPLPPAFLMPMQEDPSPVLDLHGLTLGDAYRATQLHISDAMYSHEHRYVMIITGLSGQIFEEFPRWLEKNHDVRKVDPIRGGGAWKIWLRKKDI